MFKRALTGVVLSAAVATAAQAASWDLGTYTVTYDETTTFGYLAGAFTTSDNVVGFNWQFAGTAADFVSSLTTSSLALALPSFTITANASGALYGPVSITIGKLAFTEVGAQAATSAMLNGSYDSGSGATAIGGSLSGFNVSTSGPVTSGSYVGTFTAPTGSFQSFDFSGTLALAASGGAYSGIQPTPDNSVRVEFHAAVVPEPETYAMWFAGLLGMAALGRRRSAR